MRHSKMSQVYQSTNISSIDPIKRIHNVWAGDFSTMSYSSIVNKHIQTTERLNCFIQDLPQIIVISNIADDAKCLFKTMLIVL